MHNTALDREINQILTKASLQFDKHWRSHSFRATFIRSLLQTQPIHRVSKIVGHKSIGTTYLYDRTELNKEQIIYVIHQVDAERLKLKSQELELAKKLKVENLIKQNSLNKNNASFA